MDKFKDALDRIFKCGPEPKDFLIIFGLIVAGIVVALGSITSVLIALAHFFIAIVNLSWANLFLGLAWCIILAFFVAIIIIAVNVYDDIVW